MSADCMALNGMKEDAMSHGDMAADGPKNAEVK
jgi:hypothetical protein